MPKYIHNFVAIKGEDEQIANLRAECFSEPVWVEGFPELSNMFLLDLDRFFGTSVPEELSLTGSPTRVFETQAEVNEANERYMDFPFRGETEYIAITSAEASRRMDLYGAVNSREWSISNRSSRANKLRGNIISSEPGFLLFKLETAWFAPLSLYHRLVSIGFKVSWAWEDELGVSHGTYGDYSHNWHRRTSWEFSSAAEWDLESMREAERKQRIAAAEERRQRNLAEKRLLWHQWFLENPGVWKEFFPNHNMEAFFSEEAKSEELEGEPG